MVAAATASITEYSPCKDLVDIVAVSVVGAYTNPYSLRLLHWAFKVNDAIIRNKVV